MGIILFMMIVGNRPFENAKKEDPFYNFIVQNAFKPFWSLHSENQQRG